MKLTPKMTSKSPLKLPSKLAELLYIHHVNFYVKDANLWQRWFEFYLDFQAIAHIHHNFTHTVILEHNKIQIRISEALSSCSPVAKYLQNHPQGIGEIGFAVPKSANIPDLIPSWGDITHTFIHSELPINRVRDAQPLNRTPNQELSECLFSAIDHVVVNVAQMDLAAAWYTENLGLYSGDRFTIQTEYSALRSVVMKSPERELREERSLSSNQIPIQIPINEPSTPNSQIQEFLNYNNGAGIQHLALLTDNIGRTVARLKHRGVNFLETSPPILIDRQDICSGQALMQIFTKPIFNEPTFFFEIIQRQNHAQGFGEKNFQALFEAVERQQLTSAN
jgi:4-hydroxyphenylpyruvate dioxygenase